MSDYHINIFYSDEDAAYVADIPDLEVLFSGRRNSRRRTCGCRGGEGRLAGRRARQGEPRPGPAISPGDLSGRQVTIDGKGVEIPTEVTSIRAQARCESLTLA